MVKIVRFHETGGPDVLRLEDIDLPDPGPGEARLAVEAIGLNRAEAMYRQGRYVDKPVFPSLIGYECVGLIEALGEGVVAFVVGQRVCCIPSFSMARYGVYGEAAIVPASALAAVPDGLSPIEAAAFWMANLTAYGALVQGVDLRPGETVVITAASSSVGLAAIRIAKRLGAQVVAATRTDAKRAVLLGAGADHVVATESEDLPALVRQVSGGRGAKAVFDPVSGPYVETLVKALAADGRLFIYGGLSGQPSPLGPPPPGGHILANGAMVRGYSFREVINDPERFAAARAWLLAGLAEGSLRPVIARTFPLDQIVEAHRYLENGQQVGKVVVTVP